MTSISDCSALADLHDFPNYINTIRNVTAFNLTLVGYCRNEICAALWGVGNPDVSGVGTTAGYFFETILGFLLAAACFVQQHSKGTNLFWASLKAPFWKGLDVFHDSATYFALSILVASVYSLAKKGYDISARDFGALEVQITWAVDVICILPLSYPIILLPKDPNNQALESVDRSKSEKTRRNRNLREKFRLVLLSLVVTVFIYPFVSQCIHNWAPSQIGEGNGLGGETIITTAEYQILTTTCFGAARPLSSAEDRTISAFVMIGSITIFLFTLVTLLKLLAENRDLWRRLPGRNMTMKIHTFATCGKDTFPNLWRVIQLVLLLGPLILAVPLLWGVVRLRRVQRDLASAMRSVYADNEWSFGQVVSIVMFAPVLFEMLYCWLEY